MTLTYAEQLVIAGTCHGSAVEGAELEAFSRRWFGDALAHTGRALARHAKRGVYTPELAAVAWKYLADRVELAYSAPALDPGMPGFKPATKHNIDADGRRMAAYYIERRQRRAVFKLAGVPMSAELEAGCDDED